MVEFGTLIKEVRVAGATARPFATWRLYCVSGTDGCDRRRICLPDGFKSYWRRRYYGHYGQNFQLVIKSQFSLGQQYGQHFAKTTLTF